MYTATSKAWKFSPHARARIAKRIGLLMDMAAEAKVSNILNSYEAKVVKTNYGRTLYEIPVYGVQMIAVCDTVERVVVTFIEARKWYRASNCRQRRHKNFRPKESKDPADGEEE